MPVTSRVSDEHLLELIALGPDWEAKETREIAHALRELFDRRAVEAKDRGTMRDLLVLSRTTFMDRLCQRIEQAARAAGVSLDV
jgi:hypothetical protein